MHPNVIRGLFAVGGAIVGYIFSEVVNDGEKDELKSENTRLRQQLRSVLAVIEAENGKMEDAISDVVAAPPSSLAALKIRLRAHGLSKMQIARITQAVWDAGLYGAA